MKIEPRVAAAERDIFATFAAGELDDAKSPEVRRKLLLEKAEAVLGAAPGKEYRRLRQRLDELDASPKITALRNSAKLAT